MGAPHTPRENALLAGLPPDAYRRVAAGLTETDLSAGNVLRPPYGCESHFHFVGSGIVSLLSVEPDGHTTEVGLVGPEGGLGLALVLGGAGPPLEATIQSRTRVWRADAAFLRSEFGRGGALQRNLLRYTEALMTQFAQTVICARFHSVECQVTRWLLLTLQRLRSDTLSMTQDTIAQLLGVRRAGVTEAINHLQHAGILEHGRGWLRVLDHEGLEGRACECYAMIRAAHDAAADHCSGHEAMQGVA